MNRALWLLCIPLLAVNLLAAPLTGKPWVDMDYGPFLTATIEAPHPRTNFAYKGIAIRLGDAFGGTDNEAVVFDTDLLRYSVGWTGNYVALKGVAFDGEHWAYPRIDGRQIFGNPMAPGWGKAGSFKDPREYPFGPLPRDWGHWSGLYLNSNKVVLAYTIGDGAVLEMPGLERNGPLTAFNRTLNLGPSDRDQIIQIAFDAQRRGEVVARKALMTPDASASAGETLALLRLPNAPADLPPAAASPDQGLLGRWEFNEAGGNRAADDSGHGRTLDLNGVSWSDDGRDHTTGLEFDGKHFGEISRPEDVDFAKGDLTIAAWIQTTRDGSIVAKTAPGEKWVPDGATLFVGGGRLRFDVGWVGAVASSRTVNDAQWHHVALTWAHAEGRATLFVDGAEDGSARLKPRGSLRSHVLRVGFTAPNFPSSPWFRGRLDGLRMYDRALAPVEVAALAGQTVRAEVLVVGVVGAPAQAKWLMTAEGHIRLQLPARVIPAKFKVLLWSGPRESITGFAALVQSSPAAADLEPLTRGGPPRWPQKLVTRGASGVGDGAYVVDTLKAPEDNPWHSWIRFGGLDFFADGKRAALCTWSGDVWVVSGVDGDLKELTWQRVATGLFQPLGLKIVKDQVYVLGRDQITRLHDLNGDGEADFYENFNHDCMVSEHFHEFATDLKTDRDGNFYYIKCARHALPASHPHHGSLIKVSPDGQRFEVVARGFRAVNGLGVGPNGEITCVDNQGHWMPGNRINWVEPGGWYGNQWAWNPAGRTNYDEPLCWMHNFVDRSGGTHLWVPDDRWGPLRGGLITLSYGMGHMFLVLHEQVGGVRQGGVTRFPLEFDTGVMRGVFHPQNGQLYGAGLYGWAGNKTKPGDFYRIRYAGKPLRLANSLHAARDGVVIGFTDPLDPNSATDPGNYDVQAWNYRWTEQYGSPDFKPDGQEGRERLTVASATLAADRRSVFLKLPDIQPVMQMHIVFRLRTADGSPVENFVHNTIHRLNAKSGAEIIGQAMSPADGPVRAPEVSAPSEVAPGLVQVITATRETSSRDVRSVRLAALFVPKGEAVTPFVEPGPFQAVFSGFLKVDLNDEVALRLEGHGGVRLRINDTEVLQAPNDRLEGRQSPPVPLRRGLNRFELVYESPADADAELRLLWSSKNLPLEPVPPTVFVHDAAHAGLGAAARLRRGRELFAVHLCTKCHLPDSGWPSGSMPELQADAPVLDGVGGRLNASWIARYLTDPKAARTDGLMPRVLRGGPEQVETDARDLAAYLTTLDASPAPAQSVAAANAGAVAKGKGLFDQFGCVACHRVAGEKPIESDTRLNLDLVPDKWRPAALTEFLRQPNRNYHWVRMPDYHLSAEEAGALSAFLFAQREPSAAGLAALTGSAARGKELASGLGCLACHTLQGQTNQATAPSLKMLAAGTGDRGCLAETAAGQGKAPEFGFDRNARAAVREFAQSGLPRSLQRDVPAEFASREYGRLRCNACHARDSETDFWTKLLASGKAAGGKPAAPVDDEEAAMSGKPAGGSVHVGRPQLTFAGEKLQADWMRRFLTGRLTYKPRPESQGRMPSFPAHGERMAEGFAHQHGYSAAGFARPKPDRDLAGIGATLTLVGSGFGCVSCHDVGSQKALAGTDTATVNFAFVADRVRESYFWRYVRDPQRLLPGTMMPNFMAEDGTTPLKTVYEGDARRQFTAVWNYLLSLHPEIVPGTASGNTVP